MFRAVTLQSKTVCDPAADTDARSGGEMIGVFLEGPGLRDCARPVISFLRAWRLRPLSVWQQDLAGRDWKPWQASLVTRTTVFLWFLAGHLVLGLLIVAVLFALGALAST